MELGGGPPLPEILREEEEERVSDLSHSGLNNHSMKAESHTHVFLLEGGASAAWFRMRSWKKLVLSCWVGTLRT